MAWEWSHTGEAYENVHARLSLMPREWLNTVFAEWRAAQGKGGTISDHEKFNERKYERALAWVSAGNMTDEQLVEFIWERMEELRTCTNGGWEAYACPSGCGCHLIPFERIGKNKDADAVLNTDNGYVLTINTHDADQWCKVNLAGRPGYTPDAVTGDYTAGEAMMHSVITLMRRAGFSVNTPKGFDREGED
jgi:hypothetical protein